MQRLILAAAVAAAIAPFAGAQAAAAACPAPTTGYAGAVSSTPGLVGYWRLGETSGTVACDATGQSDGEYRNPAGYTLGVPGAIKGDPDTAARFDGSSGYVNVGAPPAGDPVPLSVGDHLSIEAWVKRDDPTNGWQTVATGWMPGASSHASWVLMFDGLDRLVLRRAADGNGDGGVQLATSTTSVSDHNWHYIAATKDGSEKHLYIDGKDVTGPVEDGDMPDSTAMLIGRGTIHRDPEKYEFPGTIDELAVYNRAVTADEVANHYLESGNSPGQPPRYPEGVKAIWGTLTLANGPNPGQSAFPTYRDLGVNVFQYQLSWKGTATTRPANPTDPNDPAYKWPPGVQTAIDGATANDMSVALLVRQSPDWSHPTQLGDSKTYSNSIAPDDAQDYADFLTAARKKYPAVNRWMIWGESNREAVWSSSVHRYADLLDAAYGALKADVPADPGDNLAVGGMTFTYGDAADSYPVYWIRDMTCTADSCAGNPSSDRPRFDEWGHNPFTHRCPVYSDTQLDLGAIDMSGLPQLEQVLYGAFGEYKPLWLSEFSVSADRPNRSFDFWISRTAQAYWLARAFKVAGHAGTVAGLGWFNIEDENAPNGLTLGLLDTSGNPKPDYAAYKEASLKDLGDPGACGSEGDPPSSPNPPNPQTPDAGTPSVVVPPVTTPAGEQQPPPVVTPGEKLKISIAFGRKIKLGKLLKRLRFTLKSNKAGVATAKLRLDRATTRRLLRRHARKGALVGKLKKKAVPAGRKKLSIRPSRAIKRKLRHAKRKLRHAKRAKLVLTVNVVASEGGKASKKGKVRLRR